MDFENFAKLAVNYGLGIILSIGMAVFMGWLLKYVLKQNELREQRLADIINKDITLVANRLREHDERAASAIKNMEEAMRRQREEHEQQQAAYAKIEEEGKNRREAQLMIISTLSQINVALASINANTNACPKRV